MAFGNSSQEMNVLTIIGKSILRKESWDKVTGKAKYTGDYITTDALHVELIKSTYAHANLIKIDITKAKDVKGVRAIILGGNLPLIGEEVMDRPPIAVNKVRYYGEVIALIVADSESLAKLAASKIAVQYEPLSIVKSGLEAIQSNAPIIHEDIEKYIKDESIYPQPGTNIINHAKIRKGNMEKGW